MEKIDIAKDFSKFPAGRFPSDGPYCGANFRKLIVEKLAAGKRVTIYLDGTLGLSSGFLHEAFAELVHQDKFTPIYLKDNLKIISSDPSIAKEIWSYIE